MSDDYPGASPVIKPTGNSNYPGASSVKKIPPAENSTDPVRSAYRGVANTLYQGINKVGDTVGKAVSYVTPEVIKNAASNEVDYLKKTSPTYQIASKIIAPAIQKEVADLSQYNSDLKPDLEAFGKNTKAAALLPAVKPIGELAEAGVGKALKAGRESINAKSDAMALDKPITKENAAILKTLQKAGHSPEEIVEILKRAKEQGMTVGEASNNPDLLGLERKISGLNKPGGKIVRDFVKNRVDPSNNVSIPFKLKSIADPLVKEVDRASKEIGTIVNSSPKTPLNMSGVLKSLSSEKRPPSSMVTNTLNRIDKLSEWASEQGNTFEAWHRVKQEIWNLKNEAKDANSIEKLDARTANDYYKKVNDVLSGKSPGLPADLSEIGSKYNLANKAFSQNLSGRTISEVLNKMPKGGTPASSLKFLYKQLAGSQELQEELFEGMPSSQRAGMMKFLEAIKDSGRGSASDVVKSMQQGSPSFPLTTRQVLHKTYDKISDLLTKKDYDALGKALTSPDVEEMAKKLGYVMTVEPAKPLLRLTYKPSPSNAEISVNTEGAAKIVPEAEQKSTNQARERMKNLGFDPGILRAQDLNAIRSMEEKYGQSELGKFVIANKNEPIMGRAWEVPHTEYSQDTVDKMMRNSAWQKLDKDNKAKINAEIEQAWNSHQVTIADMILSARQAAAELAKAKREPLKTTSVGHALLNAVDKDEIPSTIGASFDDFLNNQ